MKLRLKGNSLRFRLQRSEVAGLFEGNDVSELLNVGPTAHDTFCYRLSPHTGDTATIHFADSKLTVGIPAAWAKELETTEKVGFAVELSTTPETSVRLTIEKDFECLMERLEDKEGDPYPNPESSVCATTPTP